MVYRKGYVSPLLIFIAFNAIYDLQQEAESAEEEEENQRSYQGNYSLFLCFYLLKDITYCLSDCSVDIFIITT